MKIQRGPNIIRNESLEIWIKNEVLIYNYVDQKNFQAPELSETPKNFCWFLTRLICFVGVEDAISCSFAFCVHLLCAAGAFEVIIFSPTSSNISTKFDIKFVIIKIMVSFKENLMNRLRNKPYSSTMKIPKEFLDEDPYRLIFTAS